MMRTFTLGLLLLASASAAQSANQVTLKYDDGEGVTGELLTFENDTFRIEASVGLIAISAQDVSCIGAACPDGTKLEIAPAPVTLTSSDGTFRIEGNVLEFVNDEYVVATNVGELRINASDAICEGDGCVTPAAPVDRNVSLVSGTTVIEGELLNVEDGSYIIDVDQLGELRVDSDTFECRGEACP